jgi:Signal transduction histidine kinase
MQKLSKGNLLYKTNLIYGTQYIKLGNDILSITVNAYSNVFLSTVRTNGFTLLFAILLGMLLTSLTFKRMLGTFSMVIEAIQEVSKGNFDTKLPIKHAHGSGLSFVNSFNKMTTELSKMETLRNDFISNVSHEFKTPISSIQGFATLLSQSDLSEEQMEYAKIIASESSRLANLSANILKLTKLQNQEIVTEKQLFALDEQLRQCLLILEKKWEDKNINLEIFLDEIKCYGNKELLEQVWINLIDNAIKYTNISGTIILSCTQDNDNIIVSIKDDGIGMNKNSQGRIFEKFYQGDKAHNSEGNGLGLSLVKRIVDLCNGTIEFESEENKGTTFVVSLPIENS